MSRARSPVDAHDALARLFRHHGFEGVTLSTFERATGLPRASLYYRFPEGKDSMAREALRSITQSLREGVLADVAAAPPAAGWALLRKGLLRYYDEGRLGCVLGAFSAPAVAEKFRPELADLVDALLDAVEALARRSGAGAARARTLAQDFLVDLQGSLVVASVTGEPALFGKRLRASLRRLAGEGAH